MKFQQILSTSLAVGSMVLGATLATMNPASATTWSYEWDSPNNYQDKWWHLDNGANNGGTINVSNRPGYHKSVTTTYDDQTNVLTWESVFEKRGNGRVNGGWLVLSDGPNPKAHDKEFAIFYMDGNTGKLTAHAYNGKNNSQSYKNNEFLQSWNNAVNVADNGNQRTLSFSVNVAGINARNDIGANWKGASFARDLGIWFHATKNTNIEYNEDGSLKNFGHTAGWFDSERNSLRASQVPEPASTLLISGLALGGGGLLKKKLAGKEKQA